MFTGCNPRGVTLTATLTLVGLAKKGDVAMNRKVTRKSTTTPRRIALELRHDRDGRYRWYEQETDADTEVSATTPAQAWQDAAHVWGADVWDFKRVSDTTATINADDGAVTSIIEKSIREEFPGRHNKGLRAKVRKAAATGYPGVVRDIASQVALTANGRASLEAVARAMMPAYAMSQLEVFHGRRHHAES